MSLVKLGSQAQKKTVLEALATNQAMGSPWGPHGVVVWVRATQAPLGMMNYTESMRQQASSQCAIVL